MTTKHTSLAQLLAKRPSAAFTRTDAVEARPSTPFFDHIVEGASGTESFEALLTKLTGPVDAATIPQYPTPECLTPEQMYKFDTVGEQRQAHLAVCPWCKNMLVAAQPTDHEFEEICRKAKAAARAQQRREMAAY